MVAGPNPSPTSPNPATVCCATSIDTPIVISGRSIATRLRYTMTRMLKTVTTVEISMINWSRAPILLRSSNVAEAPTRLTVSAELAVASLTVSVALR